MGKRAEAWSRERYAEALKGVRVDGYHAPGLRNIASGFDAAKGYDLRRIDEWTPGQKRKVRENFHKMRLLEAQPKRVIYPRSKKSFKMLAEAFHEDIKIPGMKAIFLPYVEPIRPKGSKRRRVKVKIRKGTITIDDGYLNRGLEVFDRKALVADTRKEVARAVKALGKVQLISIQVGVNQTLNNWNDLRTITGKIEQWMMKYDGRTPFQRGDGKFGERPKNHHWKNWLVGVKGYSPAPGVKTKTIHSELLKGFKAKKEENAARAAKRRKAG